MSSYVSDILKVVCWGPILAHNDFSSQYRTTKKVDTFRVNEYDGYPSRVLRVDAVRMLFSQVFLLLGVLRCQSSSKMW